MKPPKNFYSNLYRRKQGLPEVPEASAADAGKVIKVGNTGDYELGSDEGLPNTTGDDNSKMLQVVSGRWAITNKPTVRSLLAANNIGIFSSTRSTGLYVLIENDTTTYSLLGYVATFAQVRTHLTNGSYPASFDINSVRYAGINIKSTSDSVLFSVTDGTSFYLLTLRETSINLEPIRTVKYLSVTVTTGLNAISLPDDMTFDDLKSLLDVGTVYIVDDSTHDIYSIEKYDGSYATFRQIDISSAYVSVDSIEFNNLGGTYSQTKVDISA